MTSKEQKDHPVSLGISYFQTDYLAWDVIAYLKHTLLNDEAKATESPTFRHNVDLAIDTWIKGLEKVVGDEDMDQPKRRKASNLLESYRQIHDASSPVVEIASGPEIIAGNNRLLAVNANRNGSSKKGQSKMGQSGRGGQFGKEQFTEGQSKNNGRPNKRSLDNSCSSSFRADILAERFKVMKETLMWKLPSGALVEKVLYDAFRNTSGELLAHSYIIDIGDPRIERLFHPLDWAAVCAKEPKWPEYDESLVTLIVKFTGLESPKHLRRILNENPYPPVGEPYVHDKHYDGCWVHLVFNMLHPLYQRPDRILWRRHDESWYDLNVWSAVLDRCLQGLEGMDLREKTSFASAARKNQGGVDTTKRQKMGPCYDGVLRDYYNHRVYAVVETSKTFGGEVDTKWLYDSRKVAKGLHDILFLLQADVDTSQLKELQVAGLVSAGLTFQVLRMSYAEGHVCILSRDEQRTIPATVKKSLELGKVLLSI
ncbi:hypothetical protein HOY82DRAFT_610152 [Tuber indicum]|nr:hypothetical protein HOY82DRAFT_610152 [Tuber indicum]